MGRYLLDTHTLLWMQEDSSRLSDRVREIIEDADSELYVSIATFNLYSCTACKYFFAQNIAAAPFST
ncbi:MAG: hypothetical protein ABS46_07585 [Cytophagaceae bacterium SCN 52-12]|nr:MAG: hypothetical protein ABS46_07585 [Cytophagaceae bacterium SCN 52-12]